MSDTPTPITDKLGFSRLSLQAQCRRFESAIRKALAARIKDAHGDLLIADHARDILQAAIKEE